MHKTGTERPTRVVIVRRPEDPLITTRVVCGFAHGRPYVIYRGTKEVAIQALEAALQDLRQLTADPPYTTLPNELKTNV